MKKVKMIVFHDVEYKMEEFTYRSGRLGLFMTKNGSSSEGFAGTVDLPNTKVSIGEVIIKNHDFNRGLLEALIEQGIIEKQARSIILGFNTVYECKLKR